MTRRFGLSLQIAMAVACVGYSAFMAQKLPSIVPTHWNIEGKPDQYGSPAISLWMMPGTVAFMILLTLALPALSPKKYEVSRFERTFAYTMVLVTALMAALHVVILNASAGAKFDMSRVMMTILFAFFALIGNVLGKVKQNFYVGIRTPWTLADARVWDATHREASHIWLVGGIIGSLISLAGVPMAVSIVFLLLVALIPVVRSYLIYRRIVGQSGD